MGGDVDVIIPVHDRKELLLEAVASVLSQTLPSWRLFIIENGSSLLRSADFPDERISLHHLHDAGVSAARNHGVSLGNSEFIAFLDSDDLWHPRKLENQIRYFRQNPETRWLHTDEEWFRDGRTVRQKSIHKKSAGGLTTAMMERCLISPSAVIFRRTFWESTGGFLPQFPVAEDYECWLRCALASPIGYLDEKLTIKRAGNWRQLSSTREIDRYRVLALHRFHRLHSGELSPSLREFLRLEMLKKTDLLIRGAAKYGHARREKRYRAWSAAISRKI